MLWLSLAHAAELDAVPIAFAGLVFETSTDRIPSTERVNDVVRDLLRTEGLHVVQSESKLFEVALNEDVQYVLGAVVSDADFHLGGRYHEVQIRFDWELLDPASKTVVYTGSTAGYDFGGPLTAMGWRDAIERAAQDGVRRLLHREAFLERVQSTPQAPGPRPTTWAPLSVSPCLEPLPLPAGMSRALDGTVTVEDASRRPVGTAVIVSPDGFAVTAAHVVDRADKVIVKLHDGPEVPARVVRVDNDEDIALLRIAGLGYPCIPLASSAPAPGADLWAVGTPLGDAELELSVARGISSGMRRIEGVPLIQTDAAVSPGYSGGPLLTADGVVAGITQLKVVGAAVEGLAFGLPATEVRARLALVDAERSDDVSGKAPERLAEGPQLKRVTDPPEPDRMGTLSDPLKARMRKNAKITLGLGLAATAVGLLAEGAVVAAWTGDDTKSQGQLGALRRNDVLASSVLVLGLTTATWGGVNLATSP